MGCECKAFNISNGCVFLCNSGVMKGAVGASVLLCSHDCTHNDLKARDQRRKNVHTPSIGYSSPSLSLPFSTSVRSYLNVSVCIWPKVITLIHLFNDGQLMDTVTAELN